MLKEVKIHLNQKRRDKAQHSLFGREEKSSYRLEDGRKNTQLIVLIWIVFMTMQ